MMNALDLAQQTLLMPTHLNTGHLQALLSRVLSGAIDHADIYMQATSSEHWLLEDSIVKEGSFNMAQGVGIRAMSEEKTGFAYAEDLVLPALEKAADAARSIVRSGQSGRLCVAKAIVPHTLYPTTNPLSSLSELDKIALLQQVDQEARRQDPRIQQVMVGLHGAHEIILLLNSEGVLSADVRPLVRMNVTVIAEHQGKRVQGFSGGGSRGDYTFFMEEGRALFYAREAVRQALVNIEATPAPAGMMPVVLGPGWPGVLLHEAIGHGLEGDFNRRGTSAFTGKLGKRVAVKGCTVVDDGTMPGRRGSLGVDDEGTPSQYNVLIEDGILKSYLQDKLNARLMNMVPTGNGRRESYAHIPMPRMTNTYMLPGDYTPQEIIESVDKGLYAVNFGGGQVDITSGKFVFSTNEAYLIEKGKITRPIKGATLIGNGPDVLMRVAMIGNDLQLDSGIGVCGKDGQSVPVGVGQPTLRVDDLTVGGTQ